MTNSHRNNKKDNISIINYRKLYLTVNIYESMFLITIIYKNI
ncbi:MAG: hypothetical protein BWY70_01561 [Bacteroidetes bacterium ADurb.Bin408]|nr:MAG: hypothetical protein BWY70_01561 [Bacteroidetes bacterium ADurb.Bin408]